MKAKKSISGKLWTLIPGCKEVTLLIIKDQEISLSLYDKCRMYFHVFVVCKFCKLFFWQSQVLHKHFQQIAQNHSVNPSSFQLSEVQKAEIQAKIEFEINGK